MARVALGEGNVTAGGPHFGNHLLGHIDAVTWHLGRSQHGILVNPRCFVRRFCPGSRWNGRSVLAWSEVGPESADAERLSAGQRRAHSAAVPEWRATWDQPWQPTVRHPFSPAANALSIRRLLRPSKSLTQPDSLIRPSSSR